MISCAAIQKLERYGQLGQKRRSVEDFIQSSLKDPKRGNVYALTHQPTWAACLEALTFNNNNNNNKENNNNNEDNIRVKSDSIIAINDSLLYAVSFATALVTHHIDEQRDISAKQHNNKNNKEDITGKVFTTRLTEAVELLTLLKNVTEACGRHIHRRSDGSPAITQALAQLLSIASDTVLISTILRYSETIDMKYEGELLRELSCSATGLLITSAKQLRTAQARQPVNTLHNVRPCPTLLHQFLSKVKGNNNNSNTINNNYNNNNENEGKVQECDSEAIVTRRLIAWASSLKTTTTTIISERRISLIASLSSFTLFQKLSLVDAIVAESPPSYCCYSNIETYRRILASFVSSAACNRATRVVVYYRGDDIKLMQNNVRDTNEYSLHTHVTTPPAEENTLKDITQLSEAQQQFSALLLTQWMSSISFFFRSFCAEQSWTAFAQEQRRMILLQETQIRRQRRELKKRGVHGSSSRSSSVDNNNNNNNKKNINGDDNEEEASMISNNNDNDNEDYDERQSLFSQQSALSQLSRASMISTMSKTSVASYQTFLSVIDAARSMNENNNEESHVHQSEDGNTNLPLILLEEVTLALQRFVSAAESDAGVSAKLLDHFGLRALMWRTIGDLYSFIQSTISNVGLSSSSKLSLGNNNNNIMNDTLPPVFNLGQDIRYNKGLGYEVLGLLFAKVVLPQLLTAHGELKQLEENKKENNNNNNNNKEQNVIEAAALTRCLSAYEVIAPQVVDQNVPAILRIASHVAMRNLIIKNEDNENDGEKNILSNITTTMLHEFLISLITRLGRSNQIPMLLDAAISHVKFEGNNSTRKLENINNNEITTFGLHEIFSHPRVRSTLVEACSMSLDPEELLIHLLAYISQWVLDNNNEEEENNNNDNSIVNNNNNNNNTSNVGYIKSEEWKNKVSTMLSKLLPQEALFILDLTATVMEGVVATSITASNLLERAAELELILSTFLVNHLHKEFFAEEENEENENNKKKNSNKFIFIEGYIVRPKMQRRLVLYTLYAIYQARELIFSCLQDLGIQNVENYLQILEETMWQLQTRVGDIIGSLTIDDINNMMSSTTQMRQSPYIHRAILLPRLALQRLTLAKCVSVALNISISPITEARRLITFVLQHMHLINYNNDNDNNNNKDIERALQLANQFTEEEWSCIVQFGRPKKVRQAFVWLLRVSFSNLTRNNKIMNPTNNNNNNNNNNNDNKLRWLAPCLSSCAGFVLEALCDVVMEVTDDDVRAYCFNNNINNNKEENENENEEPLVQLCAALANLLTRLGHMPQWPTLLQRCVHWLLILTNNQKENNNNNKNAKKSKNKENNNTRVMQPCLLQRRLIKLILNFLTCEDGLQGLFRRVLLQQSYNNNNEKETQQNNNNIRNIGRKSNREDMEQVNEAFVKVIGVPFVPATSIIQLNNNNNNISNNNKEEEENKNENDENNNNEATAQQTAAVFNLLIQQIFSKEFATLLVYYSGAIKEEKEELNKTNINELKKTTIFAGNILRQLYTTALAVSRIEKVNSNNTSIANIFIISVVEAFQQYCSGDSSLLLSEKCEYTSLSTFLKAMNGSSITFIMNNNNNNNGNKNEVSSKKRSRYEKIKHKSSASGNTSKENEVLDNNNSITIQEEKEKEIQHNEITLRWMNLLGELFQKVMQNVKSTIIDKTEGKLNLNVSLLSAFTALYISLEKIRGSSLTLLPSNNKQINNNNNDIISLASVALTAPHLLNTFKDLSEIFSPENEEEQHQSISILFKFLNSGKEIILQTLWVLFVIYEDYHKRLMSKNNIKSRNNNNNNNNNTNNICWFAKVLSIFKPEENDEITPANKEKLLEAILTIGNRPNKSLFYFKNLQNNKNEFAYSNEEVTKWLLLQLRVMPSILHAFSNENNSSPILIQQYMHALLHASVPSTLSTSLKDSSNVSNTSASFNNNNNNNNNLLFWKRHEELLIAASAALRELSNVPYLRFSAWRSDVKKLLVSSGNMIFMHEQNNNNNNNNNSSLILLFCRVLELCALPLPTLHEDDNFLDHELYFVQTLLHAKPNNNNNKKNNIIKNTNNNNMNTETNNNNNNKIKEYNEEVLLQSILHLFTRALLPLSVLWKRPHLLPALFSSLFTRCLDGVSCGSCGRSILNQLSSFFYQLVKDASHNNNNNNNRNNNNSSILLSSSVKSLCLASITSCLFRLSANYVDVFTTHSSDLDFFAADFLKSLQHIHLPRRRTLSVFRPNKNKNNNNNNNNWSDATLCDLSYACVGNDDSQSLLRQAAERVEEDEGNGERHIFMIPTS